MCTLLTPVKRFYLDLYKVTLVTLLAVALQGLWMERIIALIVKRWFLWDMYKKKGLGLLWAYKIETKKLANWT